MLRIIAMEVDKDMEIINVWMSIKINCNYGENY